MKVLFVCFANAGRSQVAAALFNRASCHEASSAGTNVAELLARRKPHSAKVRNATGGQAVMAYLKAHGIDPAENLRRQLTREMVDSADRVVVITSRESWPPYLAECTKVEFWDIPNAVGMTSEATHQIYDQVKRRVEALVAEMG